MNEKDQSVAQHLRDMCILIALGALRLREAADGKADLSGLLASQRKLDRQIGIIQTALRALEASRDCENALAKEKSKEDPGRRRTHEIP